MMLLLPLGAWAQDVIVKKDGSTVECRVEKVSSTDVTYKLWTDLQGSSYIIDKSLVSAINYENGKKETFIEAESLYKPNNQNNGVQAMNDNALLKMDWAENGFNKKVKRLRTWGWIGGGVLVAAGALMIGTSDTYYNDYDDYLVMDWALIAPGIIAIAGGIATTTCCLVKAHKLKKQSPYSVNASPLYRQEFRLKNGASLATGVDFLKDNTRHNPTLGIGLSYNF